MFLCTTVHSTAMIYYKQYWVGCWVQSCLGLTLKTLHTKVPDYHFCAIMCCRKISAQDAPNIRCLLEAQVHIFDYSFYFTHSYCTLKGNIRDFQLQLVSIKPYVTDSLSRVERGYFKLLLLFPSSGIIKALLLLNSQQACVDILSNTLYLSLCVLF